MATWAASSLLLILSAGGVVGRSVVSGQVRLGLLKERPVMKVVRLLKDMRVELQAELDDDKKVHDLKTCWCTTNDKEKTQAIELGEATMEQMQSTMEASTAKVVELKEKRKATMDEINANHAALSTASALRMKESKAFQGEETDLIEAVKACKQAVVVLSKHNPGFAQLHNVARILQDAHVPQLVSSSHNLGAEQLDALKSFLTDASAGQSFLAVPGYQSYAPSSGQIFGVLKQMQEDFEASLSDAQKAELHAQEEYTALKQAKEEELAAGKRAVLQLDEDIASFGEKHAQAAKEHADAQGQLALDKEFLSDLQTRCSESAEEFDARSKQRMEEIAAVEDTIAILNSDEAFDVFDKSVNTFLLQTSASNRDTSQRTARASARLLIERAARFGEHIQGSAGVARIAAALQLDVFDKVKEEIDKLIAELSKQQADEVMQRDWCTEELANNARETSAAEDKKRSIETKITDLEKFIEESTAKIESAKEALAEMQKQMKRAGENREAENAEFQQTITDHRLTQTILQKAIDRMKQVYAFLQHQPSAFLQQQPGAAHIATSGNHTNAGNAPARFTKYEQNVGGSKVVSMLAKVLAESNQMEDETLRAEEDSQAAYENFMKDSNKAITKENALITDLSESRAKAKASLSRAKTDLQQTVGDLSGLSEALGDVHTSCDFLLQNFEARQEARAAEMDALKEGKAILSGMN